MNQVINMKVTVTYLSWYSDFALYFKPYLMDECHTLSYFVIMSQCDATFDPNMCATVTYFFIVQ